MLYQLEQGGVEKSILQQVMRDGVSIPERIKNAPCLNWGLELYYNSFFDLSSCRPLGFSPGVIPWIDIQTYADKLNLTEEQTDDLHYYVREMDSVYLSWYEKQSKIKGKKNGKFK